MTNIISSILTLTKATFAQETEEIQSLWSGYGKISRYALEGFTSNTIIVKNIIFPKQSNHPRAWDTVTSHQRKVDSYQVETEWYKQYAHRCTDVCRIPKCYGTETIGDEQLIILEDLDAAGFPVRKSELTKEEVKSCLKWLAHFHAQFLTISPDNLWEIGSYWHLATRPDEYKAMEDTPLKAAASKIDAVLNNSKFKTLVHGDAKVANFCFSEDMTKVAAVDFQYVGGGCGMKDVAYLLGSCLSAYECEIHEKELLDFYFNALNFALGNTDSKIVTPLEKEWRELYPFAWADFSRFLLGWMPSHQKINSYSKKQVEKCLKTLAH
jgi:hypothetical protein